MPRLPLTADPDLRRRHLLALPGGVEPDEVEVLAASRFLNARWEDPAGDTPTQRSRPLTAAFGLRLGGTAAAREPGARVLRLTRHSTLTGPYTVLPDDVVALGLPASTELVFDVVATRERGERPYPGGDRNGLKRAFPDGMPVREEERVLLWLVAAARRLGGAVRTGEFGVVLVPDMESAIDLTVLTDRWVEPEEALAVVQRAAPRARLSVPTSEWNGPMVGAGREEGHPVPGMPEPGGSGLRDTLREHGVLDPLERRRLMMEAAAFDELMLAAPPAAESFGVLVDLGVDGTVAVEVAEETELPPLLRGLPWTERGVVAYRVRWEPMLIEQLEVEKPSLEHRVARTRAAPVVMAVTRALHAAVGGEIADEADFLIDPADL
ncbi:hypothetical protein KIN34_05095 [Cellulomonas sp. DKR-3]|uniref:Uncharacterized protein n=1 Tax=Cellulomonas fulva TaxID=2835530 RepID=A0ABS5TWX6_9CELL|nr:hypothetical protein [Cellulomonas fulva]MBT0993660.1 hypothetical protein [Cellulomonas fulva]